MQFSRVILFFFLIFCSLVAFAQEGSPQQVYRISTVKADGSRSTAHLVSMDDSSIVISTAEVPFSFGQSFPASAQKIRAVDIEQLHIRKKGTTGRRVLAYSGAGFILGGITGFLLGDRNGVISEGPATVLGAAATATFGALVGLVSGSLSGKRVRIDRKPSNLSALERVLRNY